MEPFNTATGSQGLSYIKAQLKPLQSNMPGRNLYDYILDAVTSTLFPLKYIDKVVVEYRGHG